MAPAEDSKTGSPADQPGDAAQKRAQVAERVRTALDAKFAEQRRQYIERLRKIEAAALELLNSGATELHGRSEIRTVGEAEFKALFDAIET